MNRGNRVLSEGHGRSGLLRRLVQRAAWVGLGLVALAGCMGWCMGWWITSRATPHCHRGVNSAPNRTVAIVPGALMYSGGVPSVTLRDRLATARDLYRLGKVRRILISGDHSRANYDEVNPSRRWLVAQGVLSAHILMDHAGLRTLDTMVRARRIFGVSDATICTQAFHLPRAVFLARRAGIDAVGVVADRRIYTVRNKNRFREFFARPKAFLDTYVLRTRPRSGGPTIPILGDARLTHDRWTHPTPEK